MGMEATLAGEGDEREQTGLSVLDICKHSAKTVLHMLGLGDTFSLVRFSTSARVVVERSQMGEIGARGAAIAAVESLCASGTTNMWDGLVKGLELANGGEVGVTSSVMLLTDGVSSHGPPRGHMPGLERWIDKNGLKCSVNTFGFGYSLKSELLAHIASACGGHFSFVPDSQLVGTVFVHSVSNLLTTCALVKLNLESSPEVELDCESLPTEFDSQLTTWGAVVELGSVQLGQSRDIPVSVCIPEDAAFDSAVLTASVRYTCLSGAEAEAESEARLLATERSELSKSVAAWRNWHVARLLLVRCLGEVIKKGASDYEESRELVAGMTEHVRTLSPMEDEGKALLEDIEGQVHEAVSRSDWYTRWGLHYYCSLRLSHLKQICCNFKDPGLQNYGGKVFRELRDVADDVFFNLPMPTPSLNVSSGRSRSTVLSRNAPVSLATCGSAPSSRRFYSRDDPCLNGNVLVKLGEGNLAEIRTLRKGMVVETLAFDEAGRSSPSTSKSYLCSEDLRCRWRGSDGEAW